MLGEAEDEPQYCGHCGLKKHDDAAWFMCGRCRVVGYCSKRHQRLAFAEHRATCEAYVFVLEAPVDAGPGDCVNHLGKLSIDLQNQIFGRLPAPRDIQRCFVSSRSMRSVVNSFLASVASSWWLLDSSQRGILSTGIFQFCQPFALVRVACVCQSWCFAASELAAWRTARMTFGWGSDTEMRGLLRAMTKMCERHGLQSFPEDPPPYLSERRLQSPVGSPLSRPLRSFSSGSVGSDSSSSLPSSPAGAMCLTGWARSMPSTPSPLLLCRHGGCGIEEGKDLWCLEYEGDRHSLDHMRRALCKFLEEHSEILLGAIVCDVGSTTGHIGIFAARYAKSVTVTTRDDLAKRLVRFNLQWLATMCKATLKRQKWSVSTASDKTITLMGTRGLVCVSVYTLTHDERGIKALQHQWQWDCGTAMRGFSRQLVAPCFDVVLAVVSTPDEATELVQVAEALLKEGGLLVACGSPESAALLRGFDSRELKRVDEVEESGRPGAKEAKLIRWTVLNDQAVQCAATGARVISLRRSVEVKPANDRPVEQRAMPFLPMSRAKETRTIEVADVRVIRQS